MAVPAQWPAPTGRGHAAVRAGHTAAAATVSYRVSQQASAGYLHAGIPQASDATRVISARSTRGNWNCGRADPVRGHQEAA